MKGNSTCMRFPSSRSLVLLSCTFLSFYPLHALSLIMTRRDSLELNDYSANTEPLLSSDHPPPPPLARRKTLPIRIPRPLLFIGIPLLLTLLYASLTQIAPLPPLPTIRIVHPGDTKDATQNVLTVAEECACGIPSFGDAGKAQTEGERMCDIYGKDTLARSRLFTGTGARVQRTLEKAQRERRALKIGILGGSGTSCS
jgi:hypothetical protein